MRKLLKILYRHWQNLALIFAAVLAAYLGHSGAGTSVEHLVDDLSSILRQRPASGQLHIVEIDARSIAAIDRWPWPRRNYAQVVDQLHAAGARSITFDVDMSSPSNPADDAVLAQSLARAGGTVSLPTFSQEAGSGSKEVAEALPIPSLARYAALAAVSVLPDPDGVVRKMPAGITTAKTPRPSLSAMIAGAKGSADADFPVDFAVAPESIPRHSFVDIRDGRFDPSQIRGRDILIGATAIELGDRYAVPRFGVIAGVEIQGLATESLYRSMPREFGWKGPFLVALAFAQLFLRSRSQGQLLFFLIAVPIAMTGLAIGADALWQWHFELAPAFALVACCAAASVAMRFVNEIRRQRRHNLQTGLPNRLALEEALQTYASAGVFAARVTQFDKITAALGTEATARLIQRLAERIALVAGGATVYRLDDRLLAWRGHDLDHVDSQASALRAMMLSPVDVAGRRVDITLALGFADEKECESFGRTIENAVLAASTARQSGIGWHRHVVSDSENIEHELSLLGEMDEAIASGQIKVAYQPKLDLKSGLIVSVETLVRWNHPQRGIIYPDQFIPLAERNDRIAGLTLHVLEQAIADLNIWQGIGVDLTCAVNISAKLLNSADFIDAISRLVLGCRIDPTLLILEVTESATMSDPEQAVSALRRLRSMGIAISMDDYGTGLSTLSYLRQLPLSEIKIDRSFVQYAHQSRSDGALVRSTVDLAHELGLKVVAEGVEDQGCLDFLASIGCDLAQGYFIGRPTSAGELEAKLQANRLAA